MWVQLLYNIWHSAVDVTSMYRGMLNVTNANLPFQCSLVMQAVEAQLLNACEWYRLTETWTRKISHGGRGEGGVPAGWKGFVPFKVAAHRLMPYTEFIYRLTRGPNLWKHYLVSEADARPDSRCGSSLADTSSPSGSPPAMACLDVGAAAGSPDTPFARTPSSGCPPSVDAAPGSSGTVAGAMYSAYAPGRAMKGRDKYYFTSLQEVRAAEQARDKIGWKWRWYSEGSHHANVIRCV